MGMAKNTRERGREQAGMTREGRRTMEKVLENTVRDSQLVQKKSVIFEKKTYLGPKQRILHHLGPFSLSPSTYTFAVLSKHMQNLKIINQYRKTRWIRKKTYVVPKRHVLCHLGPFSLSPPTLTLVVMSNYVQNLQIVSQYRRNAIFKKKAYLEPFSSSPPTQTLVVVLKDRREIKNTYQKPIRRVQHRMGPSRQGPIHWQLSRRSCLVVLDTSRWQKWTEKI